MACASCRCVLGVRLVYCPKSAFLAVRGKHCILGGWGQVLGLLEAHPHIVMDESFDGSEDRLEEPDAEEGEARVWGNMVAFLERLDDELFKSLQARPVAPAARFLGEG